MAESYPQILDRLTKEQEELHRKKFLSDFVDKRSDEEKEADRKRDIRISILYPIMCDIRRGARGSLPLAISDACFDNFTASNSALADAKRYAEEKSAMREAGTNLIIQGGPGVGKTHLAAALTWELMIKSPRMQVDFWPIVDLVDLAKAVYSDDTDAKQCMADTSSMDFIVLDDLGQERPTEWTRELVFTIISRRYNNRMPTIITTNLSPQDISDRYGDSVASRLFGGAVVLRFDKKARDHRLASERTGK